MATRLSDLNAGSGNLAVTAGGTGQSTIAGVAKMFNLNAAAAPTPATGSVLQLTGVDSAVARFEADSFAAISAFTARRANGTGASPTALASGDQIGAFNFHGYYVTGGPGYSSVQASIAGLATQNWTSTAQGTKVTISTTPNSSTTLTTAVTIDQDQSVAMAGRATIATSIAIGGALIGGTALTVVGTANISGVLTAGSNIIATGNITTSSGHIQAGASGQIYWLGRSAFLSPSDGVITISNNNNNDFGRVQFGGTTNSFGAMARDGAGIKVIAADGTTGAFLSGVEQTAPAAPAADGYRIFAQDNGGGKTQLMVIFSSGAAQQIAIQP